MALIDCNRPELDHGVLYSTSLCSTHSTCHF